MNDKIMIVGDADDAHVKAMALKLSAETDRGIIIISPEEAQKMGLMDMQSDEPGIPGSNNPIILKSIPEPISTPCYDWVEPKNYINGRKLPKRNKHGKK